MAQRSVARRAVGLGVVIALALLMVVTGAGGAQAAGPMIKADTATTELRDSQAVTISGTGLAVADPDLELWMTQCAGTVPNAPDALSGTTLVDGRTVAKGVGLCATVPPTRQNDNAGVRWKLPLVETGDFRSQYWVRAGKLIEPSLLDAAGLPFDKTITCNPDSPCSIVVYLGGANPDDVRQVLASIPISFAGDPQTGCGASTDASVTGAGSDALQDTVSRWAGTSCAKNTADPLLFDYTQAGENAGLRNFQSGLNDVAISASGFAPPGGVKVAGTRAAVPTPVAVGAAVIAAQGGANLRYGPDSSYVAQRPLLSLDMTMQEVALLFSRGVGLSSHTTEEEAPLYARSPMLAEAHAFDEFSPVVMPNGALSTPDATTLAVTTALSQVPSSPWKLGPQHGFPVDVNPPQPPLPLASGFPAFSKQVLSGVLDEGNGYGNGVRLYITDSVTAARLGLVVVGLRNAAGKFVKPDETSLAAAVKGMKKNPDGTLTPDAANPDPAAYPLPLVQYVFSPAKSLGAKQARLVSFLKHATGAGQTELSPGLVPLTPELKAQAATSLATLSSLDQAAKPTPSAAPTSPPSSSAPLPPVSVGTPPGASDDVSGDLPGDGPGGDDAGAPAGNAGPSAGAAAPTGPQQLRAARPASAQAASDAATIPVFPGLRNSALGRALPTIGLVLLALLVSTAGWLSSGRSVALPPAVRRRLPARLVRRLS